MYMKKFTLLTLVLGWMISAQAYNTVNVSDFTDGQTYTLQDGDILTGSTTKKVKIMIAKNATVTLDNASVDPGIIITDYSNAGLSPLGTCYIYLKGKNTFSSVGNNEPGIFLPSGSTVHIYEKTSGASLIAKGTIYGAGIGGARDDGNHEVGNLRIHSGTIKAYGGDYAAGIGSAQLSKCGDIIVDGGTVIAKGGEYAAGIGSGYKGKCGSITINGGTVTATGGTNAAAIGGGYQPMGVGSCGSITIGSGVTKVEATKGSGAPYSIGKGKEGTSIGTITIGGKTIANGTPEAHFIYPIPTPTDITVTDPSASTAVVSWTAASDVLQYEVRYMKAVDGEGYYTETTTGTSIILSELKSNTAYDVWVVAYGSGNLYSVESQKVRFTTLAGQGLDDVQSDKVQSTKVIRNGQIFIIRGDKTFNALGVEIQ